ncbi:hypothetical protein TBLA_0G03270 [Henningerozyma blattae CBS 6284]|uniref:UBC core domain-containing protein n=1 Tax=Henningerozyma blattae (strain ATCC 34711 / CBS 6284 / DSM 70876 / NBRC 10599 / NRRL Y-10934 / UCD 77-7) TaxID=1071380 RepID=I2H7B2_HENB6|nr:hypothetical protein TBLA_0G03270 [Tetrapisispora blattae CBS 6284]CCH62264.1 hypothetical protein TBLA_0G03270 [Tetrapisispora blattae CBS 6284]
MNGHKSSAANLLLRQYRELTDPRKAIPSFHIELEDESNLFIWNIGVMVLNEDSIYHGGYFKSQMRFPEDFPFSPPQFRFTPAIYHPNVYRDGRLCISILHQSGDPTTDEPDAETWSPVQTVESVLISIVSLLEDPNISSPANVDAAVDYRKNPEQYKQRIKMEVERSKQDIPEGFIMPTYETAYLSNSNNNNNDQNGSRSTNSNNNGAIGDDNDITSNNNRNNTNNNNNNNNNRDIADNFWYDSDMDDDMGIVMGEGDDYIQFDEEEDEEDGDAQYDYDEEDSIEFEDDDQDDDESMDNDSVMDRKQPRKPAADDEDVEEIQEVEKLGKK